MKGPQTIIEENRRAEEAAFRKWLGTKGYLEVWEALEGLNEQLHHVSVQADRIVAFQSNRHQLREACTRLKQQWRDEAESERMKRKK